MSLKSSFRWQSTIQVSDPQSKISVEGYVVNPQSETKNMTQKRQAKTKTKYSKFV